MPSPKTSIRCPKCNYRQQAMSIPAWRKSLTHDIWHRCKKCKSSDNKKGKDWMKYIGFDKNGC